MEDLSPETLAALREFASMQGICSEEEEDVLSSVRHHFDVHDKNEAFTFSFSREGAQAIEFTVHGWKRELGQTLSSTGLTIWRAAEQLSDFLYHNSDLVSGKRVCELGAGLGVVSILLDKLQCCDEIVCTDGDDDTLELLRRNAEHCDCTFDVRKLWWGEHDMILEEYPRRFDILIAADVIYEEEQVAPLLKSANAIMTDDGAFYLAYARRNVNVGVVFEEAANYGMQHSVAHQDPVSTEAVYKFTRKIE